MNREGHTGDTPTRHERFNVDDAGLLESDTWADDDPTCPSCGRTMPYGAKRCTACGQWLEHCSGSCPSCASPRCVGGRRPVR